VNGDQSRPRKIGVGCSSSLPNEVSGSPRRPIVLQILAKARYTYDKADRRWTMTVAGQPGATYGRDDANRLTSVTQGTSVLRTTYDDADRRSTLTLPNGNVTTYGYDDGNRLTSLTYTVG